MDSAPIAALERRYEAGGLWAAVVVTLGWHVASALPTVLSGQSVYRPAATGIISWLVYLVLSVILCVLLLRGGGQTAALGIAVTPVMLAGVAVVAGATPSGACLDPFSWAFASAGWLALVAFWRRPLWELAAFVGLNMATGFSTLLASGHTDRVTLARFIMTGYGVSVLQFAILVGSRALTATAHRMAVAQEAQARVENRRLAAEAIHESRRNRFDAVQQTAAELLRGLARNELDLDDAETQQRMRVAVSRLRRLIVERDDVPDPLQHELRACADTAERRGVEVDLQAAIGLTPQMPVTVRRALTEPVIQVLAATRTHARITIVTDLTNVTVAIVADAPATISRTGEWPAEFSYDDDQGGLLWAQTRWSVPSLSR